MTKPAIIRPRSIKQYCGIRNSVPIYSSPSQVLLFIQSLLHGWYSRSFRINYLPQAVILISQLDKLLAHLTYSLGQQRLSMGIVTHASYRQHKLVVGYIYSPQSVMVPAVWFLTATVRQGVDYFGQTHLFTSFHNSIASPSNTIITISPLRRIAAQQHASRTSQSF